MVHQLTASSLQQMYNMYMLVYHFIDSIFSPLVQLKNPPPLPKPGSSMGVHYLEVLFIITYTNITILKPDLAHICMSEITSMCMYVPESGISIFSLNSITVPPQTTTYPTYN